MKVTPTEALEAATAVFLLSKGKATPEQQQLAYRHLMNLVNSGEYKNTIDPATRNWMLHRYFELCIEDGESFEKKSTYEQIAMDTGLSADTVKREYLRWCKQSPEERLIDENRVIDNWCTSINSLFKVGK